MSRKVMIDVMVNDRFYKRIPLILPPPNEVLEESMLRFKIIQALPSLRNKKFTVGL